MFLKSIPRYFTSRMFKENIERLFKHLTRICPPLSTSDHERTLGSFWPSGPRSRAPSSVSRDTRPREMDPTSAEKAPRLGSHGSCTMRLSRRGCLKAPTKNIKHPLISWQPYMWALVGTVSRYLLPRSTQWRLCALSLPGGSGLEPGSLGSIHGHSAAPLPERNKRTRKQKPSFCGNYPFSIHTPIAAKEKPLIVIILK